MIFLFFYFFSRQIKLAIWKTRSTKIQNQHVHIEIYGWMETLCRVPEAHWYQAHSPHIAQHLRIKHKIGEKRKYNVCLKDSHNWENVDIKELIRITPHKVFFIGVGVWGWYNFIDQSEDRSKLWYWSESSAFWILGFGLLDQSKISMPNYKLRKLKYTIFKL